MGTQVVNGYSDTFGSAWVNAATNADLPTFGAPITTTRAGPSFSTWYTDVCLPPFLPRSSSALSFDSFRRRSARRWSVPLCLGIVAITSSRQSIRSSAVVAARNRSSAS